MAFFPSGLAPPLIGRATQVPTGPLRIGSNAPRGLIFSAAFNTPSFRDLTIGRTPTITGAPTVVGSQNGPAFSANGGTLGYPITAPTVFSMEAYAQVGASAATNESIASWNQSADGSNSTFDRDLYGDGNNKYSFYIFDGASKVVTGTSTRYAVNTISHIVATSDGANIKIYINGALESTLAAGTAYTGYSAPQYLVLGNCRTQGIGLATWSGTVSLLNVANVAWTDQEIAARAEAPFGFLLPKAQRTFFVGAAAAPSSFVINTIKTVQETTPQPLSLIIKSFQSAQVAAPMLVRPIFATRELPDLYPLAAPAPVFTQAIAGPNTRAYAATIETVQEQPWHPSPIITQSFQIVPATIIRPIFATRDFPAVAPVPSSPVVFTTAIVGANTRPYAVTIQTIQEQPNHPGPIVRASITPTLIVGLPRISQIITAQEQPWHPLPSLSAPLQGVLAPRPNAANIVTAQEQPTHPAPVFGASIVGANTRPNAAQIATTQEQPPQPTQWFSQGVQFAPPAQAMVRAFFTAQEQPPHPLPTVAHAIVGTNARPVVTAILTAQERPDHPWPSVTKSAISAPILVAPLAAIVSTTQEQPWHPSTSFLSTGPLSFGNLGNIPVVRWGFVITDIRSSSVPIG